MTREEQIRAAAIQQCLGSSNTAERKRRKWIEGAMWADAHPINRWKDAQGEDLPVYKTFTDINQSKQLAEILPIESADGYYEAQLNPKTEDWEDVLFVGNQWASPEVVIPAWSLAALLNLIQLDYKIEKTAFDQTNEFTYSIWADYFEIDSADYFKINTGEKEDLLDAAFEMVCLLKEKDLLC